MEPEQKRKEGKHDQPLPRDASEILVPIFEHLTKPDLLERCMSLGTSNANDLEESSKGCLQFEKHCGDCRWELYNSTRVPRC